MTNTRPQVVPDGHYSMTEAADLLGVNRSTIYRWRKSGYMKERRYHHCSRHFLLGKEILKIYNVWN